MSKVWSALSIITLNLLAQISQIRYRWNPWIKSSFNASYDVILRHMRFSANLIKNLQKAFQVTQIVWFPWNLTHRIFRPSSTKVIMWIFFYFASVCPQQPIKLSGDTPNRKWGHISATVWCFDFKLLTQTHDPFFERPNNFGDLWPWWPLTILLWTFSLIPVLTDTLRHPSTFAKGLCAFA